MKLFDKLKKSVNEEDLTEAPLKYWEEYSYMIIIPEKVTDILKDGAFERVEKIKGVKIKEKKAIDRDAPGKIILTYEKEEYELCFYLAPFSLPKVKFDYFNEEEMEKLKNATSALTIFMKFNKNSKKSYHLQLKLALALVPNIIGIMDESAEKMISPKWVKMAVNSNITPGPNDLYTVQAVSGKKDEVWLHTHGLSRCGITELEILQSDKKNYNVHYNIISAFASFLLDKKKEFNNTAYIGVLSNNQPIVVTCRLWTKGIKEYKNLDLGGTVDRKGGHDSRTSIIFLYKSKEDENEGKLTKISEFNNLWGDNPLFFISDEETSRMKALAIERFDFIKDEAKKKGNKIIIKIGLHVDSDDNFEHIWFELIEFKGAKFRAKLLQEPYDVKDMHEGDEKWFTKDDITDWIIYTPEFTINPGNVYIISK